MKTLASILLALALLAPLASVAQQESSAARAIATRLLDQLDAHDYVVAEASFGTQMAAAVPADKLKAVWESLQAQAGALRERGEADVAPQDGMQLVTIPLYYANAELVAKIAVAADGSIVGFLIQPAPPPAAAALDAAAAFSEREVMVGRGDRALPGTLAMPGTAAAPTGGVAAVVLVHGSGPQDRDETIGPNRPFLDIARGLAAQGIAVLRYEKRTKARPQDFASGEFGIDAETTDDAVAAIAVLHDMPGIDTARVFVLGHSQGAMMAPRIAQRSGQVAGLVLLAAPSRRLLDILLEQNKRLAMLDDGRTSAQEAAALQALAQQIAAVRANAEIPAAQAPLGQSATYWRSTDAVDAVAEAKAAALPMLILQGARDIQVVDADWQGWKTGFHDNPQVTFKLYPSLNHLGIAVEGEDDLAQYAVPGQVDPALIADIAAWIGAHR